MFLKKCGYSSLTQPVTEDGVIRKADERVVDGVQLQASVLDDVGAILLNLLHLYIWEICPKSQSYVDPRMRVGKACVWMYFIPAGLCFAGC